MNAYYLIDADKLDQARQYAPAFGLPNQLFQYVINPDGTKAVVQADWVDTSWLDENGVYLGKLLPDGGAEQGVYDELAKPEWQPQGEY